MRVGGSDAGGWRCCGGVAVVWVAVMRVVVV